MEEASEAPLVTIPVKLIDCILNMPKSQCRFDVVSDKGPGYVPVQVNMHGNSWICTCSIRLPGVDNVTKEKRIEDIDCEKFKKSLKKLRAWIVEFNVKLAA